LRWRRDLGKKGDRGLKGGWWVTREELPKRERD